MGILDFLARDPHSSSSHVLNRSVDAAQVADKLGFSRYWFAEHHSPLAAATSVQPLIATVAAQTSRIHVGAGGVLLRYQTPLRVASDFNTLAHLFPRRIDLGIAGGAVSSRRAHRLRSYPFDTDFGVRVASLLEALRIRDHEIAALPFSPGGDDPKLWM